jgi:hypothetical protein
MPELTTTAPYAHSRVNSNTYCILHGQPYARDYFFPQSGTLDLASVLSPHVYCALHWSVIHNTPPPPFSVTPLPPSHPDFSVALSGPCVGSGGGEGGGGYEGLGCTTSYLASGPSSSFSPESPALPARTIPRSGSFRGHEPVRNDQDRSEMCIASTSADPDCPSLLNVREHIQNFMFIS